MTDRLKELQRQRALAQEQLAWFDREIAALSGQAPAPPASPPVAPPDVTAAANEIISQYQAKSASVQSDVKRGCFLYFFVALAALSLGVLAFYFFRLGKHP